MSLSSIASVLYPNPYTNSGALDDIKRRTRIIKSKKKCDEEKVRNRLYINSIIRAYAPILIADGFDVGFRDGKSILRTVHMKAILQNINAASPAEYIIIEINANELTTIRVPNPLNFITIRARTEYYGVWGEYTETMLLENTSHKTFVNFMDMGGRGYKIEELVRLIHAKTKSHFINKARYDRHDRY